MRHAAVALQNCVRERNYAKFTHFLRNKLLRAKKVRARALSLFVLVSTMAQSYLSASSTFEGAASNDNADLTVVQLDGLVCCLFSRCFAYLQTPCASFAVNILTSLTKIVPSIPIAFSCIFASSFVVVLYFYWLALFSLNIHPSVTLLLRLRDIYGITLLIWVNTGRA